MVWYGIVWYDMVRKDTPPKPEKKNENVGLTPATNNGDYVVGENKSKNTNKNKDSI